MPEVEGSVKLFKSRHGYSPSGFGMWHFRIQDAQKKCLETFTFVGMFAQGKKRAMKRAIKLNAAKILVLP